MQFCRSPSHRIIHWNIHAGQGEKGENDIWKVEERKQGKLLASLEGVRKNEVIIDLVDFSKKGDERYEECELAGRGFKKKNPQMISWGCRKMSVLNPLSKNHKVWVVKLPRVQNPFVDKVHRAWADSIKERRAESISNLAEKNLLILFAYNKAP